MASLGEQTTVKKHDSTNCPLVALKLDSEFFEHDYCWEVPENTKVFPGSYEANYGDGIRRYIQNIYTTGPLVDNCGDNKYFMVVNEHFSKEELAELAPYCQCLVCVRNRNWTWRDLFTWYDPSPYWKFGCLMSWFPNRSSVKAAREAMEKATNQSPI